MATRKAGTVAAVNRQIDAMNRERGKNPGVSKSAKIKADVRRFAKDHGISISPKAGESPLMGKGEWFRVFDSWLQAYDYFTGWKWKHVDHGLPFPWDERKSNPARTATLVARKGAAKNPGSRNLAAPRKKPRENWPRFVVEEKEGVGPWMPRASFRILEDAEKLARDIHRAAPSIAVRVLDTKA